MLTYPMDQRGDKPICVCLYQCIAREIVSGFIPPDTRLPSKRALAAHLNIGVVSVVNACDQLQMKGYIR